MSLPDVTPTIQDGNLGITPTVNAKPHIKVGLAPKGLIDSLYTIGQGDTATLQSLLGRGSDLVEAAALALQQGGPLYIVTANPSTYGTVGSVTKTTSSGASTLAIAARPFTSIIVKVALGGSRGTATVQISTDGGITYGAAVVTAATLMIPGAPYVTLAFTDGTYVLGDYWTLATDGTVTFTGSGYDGCTISSQSPVDGYNVLAKIMGSGALGAATFTYSLDNGNTWSGTLLVPASGKYVIPDTGLLLTFAGALVATEAWSCTVAAPSYTTTDLTNALNATLSLLRAAGVTTGTMHVVGTPSSVGGAAALAATVQTLLDGAATNFQYLRAIIEVPTDTDANTATAFAAVGTLRVGWCAGFCYSISPLNGRQQLVSSAWAVAARLAAPIALSEDLGYVDRGPLSGVSLSAVNTLLPAQRDEAATPFLDAARFITLRTIAGRQGLYITNGRLGAPSGSDYTFMQYGLVIDVAAAAGRQALLKFLNASVRVNGPKRKPSDPTAGTIYEPDARKMENWVNQRLAEALTQPGYATGVEAVASRTASVLSTQTLPWTIGVLPLGYTKYITASVGFLPVSAA